jgi:hypothetical protein
MIYLVVQPTLITARGKFVFIKVKNVIASTVGSTALTGPWTMSALIHKGTAI